MNGRTGYGARIYAAVSVDSGVKSADPHRLILMLYDGAIAAIHQATAHLQAQDIAAKCAAVGKALRIVDEGLKASLDCNAGGQLALRLVELYDYMVMRLLQANLRNDQGALDEVARLLAELRDAWAQIQPATSAVQRGQASDGGVDAGAVAGAEPAGPTRRLTAFA